MANPKTPFPASDDIASLVRVGKSASLRLNALRTAVEAFTVPAVGTIADNRTLADVANLANVHAVLTTLIRDLKEI